MKFISQLVDMFYLTVEGIKATNSFFSYCLHISYFIGQYIVAACVQVVEKIYIALQLLYSVACIMYEDYCFFIVDLISKIKWVLSGVNFGINYLCTCVQQTITSLKHLYDSVIYFFLSNFEIFVTIIGKTGSSLYYTLEIIKQSLIFLGNSVWYFISIIPVSIVYMITLLLCYIYDTVEEFYLALGSVCNSAIITVQKLIQFFSDIPGEAAFGLILGITAFCFLVRHYNVLLHLTANFVLSLIRSCRAFSSVWIFVKNLFFPLFASSRNRVPEGDFSNFPPNERASGSGDSCRSSTFCDHELSSKLCIVCQDKEKTVIVLPCRHVCLCVVCCAIIEEQYGRCPVCRQRVERTMMVYI